MQQLTQIIQQRKRSVIQITKNHQQKHKFHLIEQQRKRCDRQNWILRVLKSLKLLSVQQKRVIYETTIKMMNNYKQTQLLPINFQSINYLQVMINLFVDFFNKIDNMDFTHLKSIIRPNNNYIIVDLLKCLIQIGRKQFKIALQQHFKDHLSNYHKKSSVKSLIKLPLINTKINQQPILLTDQNIKNQKNTLEVMLKTLIYQKISKLIDYCNFQHMHQKANELYFDLLYTNQRNSMKIQKFMDTCFGQKKFINYDASGLYTQQEIKKLIKNQRQNANFRLSEIKELKGQQCTTQQFKQYFKIQVQLYESTNNLPIFTKQQRLHQWFPFCLVKDGDKLHPYRLLVQINGNYFTIEQFQQRYGKKIRAYMKQLLNQTKYNNLNKLMNDSQYIKFKRKNSIQFGYSKIVNFLNENEPITIKKQSNLPLITSHEEQPLNIRKKVKSQSKISNHSLVIPTVQSSQLIQNQIKRRLNYSSIALDMNVPKRKIDTMIQQFIKFTQ